MFKKNNYNAVNFLLKMHPKWWIIYDLMITAAAVFLAKFFYNGNVEYFYFPVFFLFIGNIIGIYEKTAFNNLIKLVLLLFSTTMLSLILLVLFKSVFLYEQVGRHILLLIFSLSFSSCGIARCFFSYYARKFPLQVLFVGDSDEATLFENFLNSNIKYFNYIGYCDLSDIDDIHARCLSNNIDFIVIDNSYISKLLVFNKLLKLRRLGCTITDIETFVETNFEQIIIDKVDPYWFYAANLGFQDKFQIMLKRFFDVIFSISGLFFTTLIYPIIWVGVKLSASGPVIYSQVRCGQFNKEFKIYKFRTMQVDAEPSGAVWAKQNDNRITKMGRFLRKTRLDELPQFWNILMGDMSLVGPRPERPELIKKIEEQVPYFYFRHFVKPGVTGFAQIRYRYGANIDDAKEKLKYDLYYIKNWSFFMDIQIILRTVVTVMNGSR